MVAGSELYKIKIAIAPVAKARWKSICRDCAGTIDSLVELLQGRLAKGVMDRVCREGDGLFPSPGEIKLVLQLSGLGGHVQARVRPRCTASAPGSTRSLSFFSCCAAWMKTN